MRILQLSSARHFGGGERHFVDLANTLFARGHDVYIALRPDSPLKNELSKIPQDNFLTVSLSNSLDIGSAWKVRRFARARRIEIVHAHVARDYPLAALGIGGTNARLVLTRHVLFPLSRIHRLTQKRVARVIAVSQGVAKSLRAQRIFDEHKIVVVRHGINLSRFTPKKHDSVLPVADRVLRVGMIGEISPIKGQQDLIRAAAIVAAQRKDVEFIIAGEDKSADGANRRQIEELIQQFDLGGRIKLIGQLDDVPHFLSTLDLFVSASHSESFGLAILEAMAAGVPVVASATEGATELIEAEVTGRLIPIGDVDELARALDELLSDSDLRDALSAHGLRAVRHCFTLDRMVDETELVYREALRHDR